MIPGHQKFLFGLLLLASLAMGVVLWQLRDRAHKRMIAGQDAAPTRAPEVAPAEEATLIVANDSDGSLLTQIRSLPLPADPGARARAVLGKLLDLYAEPDAAHPVPGGGSSVTQVFLLDLAEAGGAPVQASPPAPNESKTDASGASPPSSVSAQAHSSGPQLAVVNLTANFSASHPSGIETETLTVLSICGTLHANLPRVTHVRFLVDGKQRPTLAGHADLTRTYLANDVVPAEGAQP